MTLDPRMVARALGGTASGCNLIAPGPGHSAADRSLSIKIDPTAPDGFVVHSFAGDSPSACRDHVRAALGLGSSVRRRKQCLPARTLPWTVEPGEDEVTRSVSAIRIWNRARDPRGTTVANYLASRRLTLPDDIAGDVIRFHPRLILEGTPLTGMVALFRDIRTNEPCGIQRTFFGQDGRPIQEPNGRKVRKMRGRTKNAAIQLDADENVTLGLTIGEGLESCLAARLAGFRPVWALGSAGAIASMPVLPGIDAITILGEVGDGGANHRQAQLCADRWLDAGREAFIVAPLVGGDLNDVWMEVCDDR